MIKTIYGNRVKLRALALDDSQDVYKNIQDDSIAYNTPLKLPYSLQDSIDYIHRCTSNDSHLEFGISHYDSKEIIGVVSIYNVNSSLPFIGYWIAKKYRGLGYAKEAVALILQYNQQSLHLTQLEATVLSSNLPSIRLLESFNFKYTKASTIKVNENNCSMVHYSWSEDAIEST